MEKHVDMIQGQQIEVIRFDLNVDNYEAVISLEFMLKNNIYCMIFHNVSNITIKEFSVPFQICGFEIFENKNRGWDKALKYTVNDFEDGKIKFFCEYFEFID